MCGMCILGGPPLYNWLSNLKENSNHENLQNVQEVSKCLKMTSNMFSMHIEIVYGKVNCLSFVAARTTQKTTWQIQIDISRDALNHF